MCYIITFSIDLFANALDAGSKMLMDLKNGDNKLLWSLM